MQMSFMRETKLLINCQQLEIWQKDSRYSIMMQNIFKCTKLRDTTKDHEVGMRDTMNRQ